MRGAFLIVIVISMLIVCFLVMKNMNSNLEPGTTKVEAIQKAEDVKKNAEEALKQRANAASGLLKETSSN